MKALFIFFCSLFSLNLYSAEEKDIDKMTTYSTILGRAIGCELDVSKELEHVGTWMDKRGLTNKYLMIFAESLKLNMQSQIDGSSPDSCQSVEKTIQKMNFGEL
ncbi:hypothetical protein AMS64_02990 [Aeromonas veronii]|uniref:hypothetical protein n=1 Tax=Aeromonas veronii TaxID=654 RepID=UPI00078BBC59|nr:hypothetical protein [Aeromonas veronii]AMQ41431.1 hypothetical protein AMS64_02990 [Aeromonas veronii]MCX0426158.1 hypothetical protein [Aeromonas veronii]POG17852.1 hypothetical protein C2849_16690 [Aeromonas veronii]